jgi:hypothetical protein
MIAMNKRLIPQDSTIYNYTLIRRMPNSRLYMTLWYITLTVCLLYAYRKAGFHGAFLFTLAIPVVLLLHCIIITLIHKVKPPVPGQNWRLHVHFPWLGFIPAGYVSLTVLVRLHNHLWLIGVAVILAVYPWFPAAFCDAALFIHCWILFPRMPVMFIMSRAGKSGLCKITKADTSLYKA